MKRFLLSILALAALLPTACNPSTQTPPPFPRPEQADHAVKAEITTPGSPYTGVEMTESGIYIIRETDCTHTGKYTFDKAENRYDCKGFGTVKVVDTRAASTRTLIITRTGQEPLTVDVVFTEPSARPAFGDWLYRTWTVEKTVIAASGENVPAGLGIAHAEPGCDLPGIQAYLAAHEVDIDADLEGYVVRDVTVTAAGTFMIRFTGQDDFVGDYSLQDSGTFHYEFYGAEDGNAIFSATADGSISFDSEYGRCLLAVDIDTPDVSYRTSVTLYLVDRN